jgi:hypothetical protein
MQPDWQDHVRRIQVTRTVAQDILCRGGISTAADLSCGDGHWAKEFPTLQWYLGDYSPGYEFRGPIEKTIYEIPDVDVFFLCETIEHLDDPESVLKLIRQKASHLVLSTPNSFQWDGNPEHYWAWDKEAMGMMLGDAGWQKLEYREANPWDDPLRVNGYCFQIWGCR